MAVTDDVRNAIDSLKKITDTIDKIEAVKRDIQLMLAVTKFTYPNIRTSLGVLVMQLDAAGDGLGLRMNEVIKQISLAQGGP